MVKNALTLLLLGAVGLCRAQTLIGTSGATVSNSNLSVSYSIGEIATASLQDAQMSITQGFQQPRYTVLTAVNSLFDAHYTLSVFPNPVRDELNVKTDYKDFVQYVIYDLSGKTVQSGVFSNNVIGLARMTPGSYLLQLQAKDPQFSKSIKLVKQ